jgi:hypothetical protein
MRRGISSCQAWQALGSLLVVKNRHHQALKNVILERHSCSIVRRRCNLRHKGCERPSGLAFSAPGPSGNMLDFRMATRRSRASAPAGTWPRSAIRACMAQLGRAKAPPRCRRPAPANTTPLPYRRNARVPPDTTAQCRTQCTRPGCAVQSNRRRVSTGSVLINDRTLSGLPSRGAGSAKWPLRGSFDRAV